MSKFRKMMSSFEKTMSAAAFAEAGEHAKAREIVSRKKKVLLGLDSMDTNALSYAANICTRIDANLEVLYSAADNENPFAEITKRLTAELNGYAFQYDLIRTTGSLQREILSHTTKRSDILFVVIGSQNAVPEDSRVKQRETAWKRLNCPLVVVSHDKLPATA